MMAFSRLHRHIALSIILPASLALIPFWGAGVAKAQSIPPGAQADTLADEPPPPPPSSTRAGQTADTAAGRVGERRRADQTDGIEPMARINSRIANRVQSRVRNRIDRNYDPTANATSPFAVAGQATGRATRRDR